MNVDILVTASIVGSIIISSNSLRSEAGPAIYLHNIQFEHIHKIFKRIFNTNQ